MTQLRVPDINQKTVQKERKLTPACHPLIIAALDNKEMKLRVQQRDAAFAPSLFYPNSQTFTTLLL